MRSTLIGTILLSISVIGLQAQDFFQIQNRWKPVEHINAERETPEAAAIQPGWWSAQWIFEAVGQSGYVQIKNRWKNTYLHIQGGTLACGAIQPGWWSAQWSLEPVAGTNYARIRNRWKPEVAVNNQSGSLQAGPVDLGWWSAQWLVISLAADGTVSYSNGATTGTTLSPRNGDNPNAFTPEHNGKIAQAAVRYTDQINVSSQETLVVGSKIYFFPQEVNANTDGLSFDPKNPPIGGQTFTVIEVTPNLKLDRPMPMMRNRNNDSFSLVVELFNE
jgi:hypothetical protein